MKNKKELIKELYFNLTLIRRVEEAIAQKYPEGKMRCPVHLSIGQEIVSAVFSQVMKKKDYAVSSHRCHGHYLAKKGSLKKMIAEIYGKKTGCSGGRGGSMHLIDLDVNFMGSSAIVGNSIPIGVGLGLSTITNNKKRLSYIFFGDGAVEEGVFHESINFAITKKIPAIFVCENNLYSVYSQMNVRQPVKRKISSLIKAAGMHSVRINTNDVLEMYNIVEKNIKLAIRKNIPIFFEIMTYRYKEHCGPFDDDHLRYRPYKEISKWRKKDPVKKIINSNKISQNEMNKIDKKVEKKIIEAFKFAERSNFPNEKSSLTKVYA